MATEAELVEVVQVDGPAQAVHERMALGEEVVVRLVRRDGVDVEVGVRIGRPACERATEEGRDDALIGLARLDEVPENSLLFRCGLG